MTLALSTSTVGPRAVLANQVFQPEVSAALRAVDDPIVAEARAAQFPDILHAHVDRFWAQRFAIAGQPYQSPGGVVGYATPIVTACGPTDPAAEVAFYCLLDETIYYSVPFRQYIEGRVGDFGWVVIVAHEWAHHVQREIGIELGIAPDLGGGVPSVELEQQADCLAGAYSVWAEEEEWLDPGDIEEALFVTSVSGDPVGTAWNSPGAHGTGDDRVEAYMAGYDGGISACGIDLRHGG